MKAFGYFLLVASLMFGGANLYIGITYARPVAFVVGVLLIFQAHYWFKRHLEARGK